MAVTSTAVVIPTFNKASLLGRALASVAAQTRPPDEWLVIDDGSTDDTRAVVEAFADRGARYIHQPNQGVSAARNQGLAASSADYLLFLDDDDTLAPEALELLTGALAAAPRPDLVHGDWDFVIDRSGRRLRQPSDLGARPVQTLLCRNPMALHCVLVRREPVLALGGFRDRQGALEDWELWLRLAVAGAGFRHLPQVVAHYHWRPGSGSSQADRMHAVRLAVLEAQRPTLAGRVDEGLWREAELGAWMDHAVNRWRADDLAGAAAALREAARLREGLLAQVDTWYRLWRADYLEALGDRDAAEAAARWRRRRRRMATFLPLLLEGRLLSPTAARAARDWALAQVLREEGRPGAALQTGTLALLHRPDWIRRPRLLRLLGRSLQEGLPWPRAGS